MHNDRRQPIAIGHLSDSGDLKNVCHRFQREVIGFRKLQLVVIRSIGSLSVKSTLFRLITVMGT